eukprot:jgi/Chrzof1/6299/Cz18g00200.t1
MHCILLVLGLAQLLLTHVSGQVVISQVYGGGGGSGAQYKNDFIELFNRGSTAVNIGGYCAAYASSTGNSWVRTCVPAGVSLAPGQFYLIQERAGTEAATALPTPDVSGNIAMSATAGKVALVKSGAPSTLCSGPDTSPASCVPTNANIADVVGYGTGSALFEGAGPTAPLSNTKAALRHAGGCRDGNTNADDFVAVAPRPRNRASTKAPCGAAPSTPGPTPAPTRGPTPSPGGRRIRDIQGITHISPLNNQAVTDIPGIVTAVKTAERGSGFFMQDPSPDTDDRTSEGIFVFTSTAPTVTVGQSVLVAGTVDEYRPRSPGLTLTQIKNPTITVVNSRNPLPAPVVIGARGRVPPTRVIEDDAAGGDLEAAGGVFDPANDGADFYESLEGMRVQINNPIAIAPKTKPNGEIWVLPDLGNGVGVGLRTSRGGIYIQAGDFNPERIQLNSTLFADGAVMPAVNVGDKLGAAVIGVVNYVFPNYQVLPTTPPVKTAGGLTKEVTPLVPIGTQMTVATFNVENLSPKDPDSKFSGLAAAIVNNLKSPDVIAIEEIQDNNGVTNDGIVAADVTWNTLINAITAAGGPTYQLRQINPVDDQDGGADWGNIRVGFLFNPARIKFVDRPGGSPTAKTTVSSVGGVPQLSFSPGRVDPANSAWVDSRKPLAAEFLFNSKKVFMIAIHFNAKNADDPLFGRKQPPVLSSEKRRRSQASIVANFVTSITAIDPNALIVVLGDLNDFQFSAPWSILENAGLRTLVKTLPASERYTYNFDGNAQVLDHIAVSTGLFAKLDAYDAVHINSEFANQLSDHDPSVARFNL